MKKSTIVLIATAVGVWIVALVTIAVLASTGQNFKDEEITITEDSKKITQVIKPFSSIVFSLDNVFCNNSSIGFVQCDTITTPQLLYSEEIADFLNYTEENDTLNISLQCSSDDDTRYSVILYGHRPLTIMIPSGSGKEFNISNKQYICLYLEGITAKKLNLSEFYKIRVNSSTIDSMNILASNNWNCSLKINDSEIDDMTVKMTKHNGIEMTVSRDSAATSTIRNFALETSAPGKSQLTFDGISVNKVSYPWDNITLSIRNKAEIGNVYSNEK